jgi:cysteinyl-tRNA synthetase
MIQEEIYYIQKYISNGWAYTIFIPNIGEFVIADYTHFKHKHNSIKSDHLIDKLKNEKDFVIWMPKKEQENSYESPWGYGILSANFYVNCLYN